MTSVLKMVFIWYYNRWVLMRLTLYRVRFYAHKQAFVCFFFLSVLSNNMHIISYAKECNLFNVQHWKKLFFSSAFTSDVVVRHNRSWLINSLPPPSIGVLWENTNKKLCLRSIHWLHSWKRQNRDCIFLPLPMVLVAAYSIYNQSTNLSKSFIRFVNEFFIFIQVPLDFRSLSTDQLFTWNT